MSVDQLQLLLGSWTERDGPLYRSLATSLAQGIDEGLLGAGARLPAERDLAANLNVARNTVGAAFDELAAIGRVERRQGAGTFVTQRPEPADRGRRELVEDLDQHALLHDLSGAPRAPIEFVAAAVDCAPEVRAAVASAGSDRLGAWTRGHGYVPLGVAELRARVAEYLTRGGLATEPRQVMITSGAVEAVLLAARLYLRPGDPVVVEAPSYVGALDVLRALDGRLLGVEVDRHGVRTEALAAEFTRSRPRLAYLIPDFHNPSGVLMDAGRRQEVARLAAEFRVPVIEDLVQRELWYDQPPPPPVAAFDPEAPVLTLGSMSKVFWGGLRVGWIRSDPTTIQRLGRLKTATNYGTAQLDQHVAAGLLDDVDAVAGRRRRELRERRAALESALRRHLPDWHWTRPAGGLSLWARLPDPVASQLVRRAERHGVAVAAGLTFGLGVGNHAHDDRVRLPFVLPPDQLREGVRRLAAAWHELERDHPAADVATRLVL